jgi:lysophospholipase L1-like esterase
VSGRRAALLALEAVLLVLAAWGAWPAREGVWEPFAPPDGVEVQFPGGTGVSADVWSSRGRLGARRPALLVFKELREPESLEVTAPEGDVDLLLGKPDGGNGLLRLTAEGLELSVAGSGVAPQRVGLARGTRVALAFEAGSYRALVDGEPAGEPVAGPEPAGPAHARLATGASIAALECATRGGDVVRAEGAPVTPGAQRLAWALVGGLLALLCLHAWVPMVGGGMPSRRLVRGAALAASLALVAGLAWSLHAHNHARLTTTPERCAQEPLALPDARVVSPGRPYALGERRDGDFTLRASVTLGERSALDLLLRAGLPKLDRQVLVTLSSDPALPGGLTRNLGTFLEAEPASEALRVLPAGQPLELEVRCHDERTDVRVMGKDYGSVADLDLRTGRTAFHALSGSATVSALELLPAGQPRALGGTLRAWELGAAGAAALALVFLALRGGRGAGSLLWCWPLAAAVAPVAPGGLVVPLLAVAALLLLLTPPARHRVLAWTAGAVLIGLAWWAQAERAPQISPLILNQLAVTDFTGPPVDARYAWARHALCRRFNGYIKDQTFRDEVVARDKPPGALRIVTLGSSSTFGYGVGARDCWSAQTGVLLAHLWPGRDVQVVNAGVPGGTAERLRFFLLGVLLDLQPDAVVIDLGFNDHIMGGTHDERAHFAAFTGDGIGPLEGLVAGWRSRRQRAGWQAFVEDRGEGRPVSAGDEARYSTLPAARFGDSIRDMVDACRAAGVAVLLVQEPTRPGENRPLLPAFHEAMARVGAEREVPVVAPQPALDAAGGELYIDVVHPNRDGHRIIARVVGGGLAALLGTPR